MPPRLDEDRPAAPPCPELIGHATDLGELFALFDRGARCVTLTGVAGVGKTTLAARFVEQSLARFAPHTEGGAWWCDLTEAREHDDICGVVGAALGVALEPRQADPVEQLAGALAARGRTLVVLDNFEQLVAHAAATVGRWLARAPEARVLVTSREQLRLPREVVYELAPLSLAASPATALESDAVRLLVEHARRTRRDWVPDRDELAALAEIARQLDGLPLALELAAARLRVLTPAALLARLGRRFELLAHGVRDAAARQRTLRGALDWSWELLAPGEQRALAQCAVFRGGFELDAAEHVLDLAAVPGAPAVLDVVQALRDKSLLAPQTTPGTPSALRLTLYLSVREYAADKLAAVPSERDAAERRHAEYYARAGEAWAAPTGPRDAAAAAARLACERDNLRAVVERTLARPRPLAAGAAADALRALLALDLAATARGQTEAHLALLGAALEAAPPELDPALRARALFARTDLRRRSGDRAGARADAHALVALAQARGDRVLEGRALQQLSRTAFSDGRNDEACALAERALALHRAAGEPADVAAALGWLADVRIKSGDHAGARAAFEHAVAASDALGYDRAAASTLASLGVVAVALGRDVAARGYFERALAIARTVGNALAESYALYILGLLDHAAGRLAAAADNLEDATRSSGELWRRDLEASYRGSLALVLEERGRGDEAEQLLRSAYAQLRASGDPSHAALCLAHLAGLDAARGHTDAAERTLREADALAAAVTSAPMRAAVDVQRARLERALAEQRAARGEPAAVVAALRERAAARIEAARREAAPDQPGNLDRLDLRIALRLVEAPASPRRAAEEQQQPPSTRGEARAPAAADALLVSADGRWFRPPSGERVECRQRRAMRLLLARLAAQRVAAPGVALDRASLLAAGWPGERIIAQAAMNRLHVTLNALRTAGLRPYLLAANDGGYLLDPTVPCEIDPVPAPL